MLIAVLFLHQCASMDAPISYSASAKRVDAVLREIGEQAHLPLRSEGAVSKELLSIRVSKTPVSEVLQKIAAASTAEWQQSNGSQVLVRTPAIEGRVRAAERAEERKILDDELARMRKRGDALPPMSAQLAEKYFNAWSGSDGDDQEAWSERRRTKVAGPDDRALVRVVATSFTADELAALPLGKWVTFSTRPNPVQRAFGRGPSQLLATLNSESAVWYKALDALMRSQADEGETPRAMIQALGSKAAHRLLVSVLRSDSRGDVRFQLWSVDADGYLTGQATLNLDDEGPDDGSGGEPDTAAEGARPLTLTPLATEFAKLCHASSTSGAALDWSKELLDLVARPAEIEPLAGLPTELLSEVARVRGKNMVACLSDDLITAMTWTDCGPAFTDRDVLGEVLDYGWTSADESERWIVFRPLQPLDIAGERVDRVLLQKIVAASLAHQELWLDDWAGFLFAGGGKSDLAATYLDGLLIGSTNDLGEVKALQVYGSLSPAQRDALRSGQTLPWRAMSAVQKELFKALVLEEGEDEEPLGLASVADDRQDGLYPIRCYEITEALPGGMPPDAALGMSEETTVEIGMYGRSDAGGWTEAALSLDQMAYVLAMRERPELNPYADSMGMFDRLARLDCRAVTLKAVFGPDRIGVTEMEELRHRPGYFSLDTLPAELKRMLDPIVAKIGKPGSGGPPPPLGRIS